MWAAMTQGFYKMFQRATAELRDDPGGDGGAARTHPVQAPQEVHSGGHHHAQGALMFREAIKKHFNFDIRQY